VSAKRVYVYRDGVMVDKATLHQEKVSVPLIMADLADFVSTVDGRVKHGRRGLREHNRELGVTNPSDFTNHWANFQKKRERLFTGTDNSPNRLQAVVRAYNELEEKGRNRRSR
jgi:hypothetical protein